MLQTVLKAHSPHASSNLRKLILYQSLAVSGRSAGDRLLQLALHIFKHCEREKLRTVCLLLRIYPWYERLTTGGW
jgi:hypothetical protein